jgi:carboxypeptidase C (cathepsin A)
MLNFAVVSMARRILIAVSTVVLCHCAHVLSYTLSAEEDRVTSLPGATSPLLSNQFSGYLNVSSTRGIHYMYFESERDPENDSVIFWTNGGPGSEFH